jgi:antitoxin FitA
MGQILVRDLPDDVIRKIKMRAAQNGRSTEAETRLILKEAVGPTGSELSERMAGLRQRIRNKGVDAAETIRRYRDDPSVT